MNGAPDDSDRLDSWKEIAAYLKRSVRTVRRWERDEDLPVHRHMHQSLGTVYAFRSEIERWRNSKSETATAEPARRLPPVPGPNRSIAVLPFDYIGPREDHAFIADGFTEEVISRLSSIRSLRVISKTSSMAFRGTSAGAPSIAKELGVGYLIEGSVRHAGETLKVSAALIDAHTDDRKWIETYEGSLADIFSMQERLARRIASSLPVQLTSDEEDVLKGRSVDDLVAWQCLVHARQESLRWRRDSIDTAVNRLETALEVVGDNAEICAALGRAHLQYREAGIDLGDAPLNRAEEYALRVFEIDPRSPAGLQLRGWVHYSRGDIQSAVRDLAAALDRDWSNADTLALLGNCLLISGKVADGRPLIERLLAIDPLTPLNHCLPGWADALEGRFDAAIGPYLAMFEMDRTNPMARLFYASILALGGRTDEVETLAAMVREDDGLPGEITAMLGDAVAGRTAAVRRRARSLDLRVSTSTELFPRMLGQAFAIAGELDRSLACLEIAVDRGFINHPFLSRHDPSLKNLRGDARFTTLLETVRARWETFEVPASIRAVI